MRFAAWTLAAAVALSPRVFAQSLPDLGGTGDVALSPQMERRIGESIVRDIRFRDPQYLDDPDVADYLASLGARLAQANPAARQDLEFFAMRDHTVNAFALPGGFIGVNTGLITTAETESELASVLAHEIGHVSQRHIARMIAQQQQLQMPMMVALAAAILLGRSRPDLAAGAAAAAQGAGIQASLAYSRDFEREADRIGLQTVQNAGFDSRAMAAFFEKMQRATRVGDDGTLPGYLRTHPVTTERIADVQNKAAAMPYRQHPDSPEFQLVRAKLRADSGDPREAAASFEAALHEHRYASEAAAHYGFASALLRAGRVGDAEKELGRLQSSGIASPMVETLAARIKTASGDTAGANRIYADAQKRYPYSRAIAYAYIDSLQQAGANDTALAALRDTLKLYPRDARLYGMQAKTYAALGKRLLQHHAQGEAYALQGSLPAAIEQLQLARRAGDGDFYQLSMVDARLKELRAQYATEMKDAKR
ncbi:MAG: M48 family metalloprotease [Burkholderiales bacterium]